MTLHGSRNGQIVENSEYFPNISRAVAKLDWCCAYNERVWSLDRCRGAQVQVRDTVTQLKAHFAPLLTQQTVLRVDAPASSDQIYADPARLFQVLVYLVSTALSASDAGTVVVAARPCSGAVRFSVTDSGPRIAPQYFQVRRPQNLLIFRGCLPPRSPAPTHEPHHIHGEGAVSARRRPPHTALTTKRYDDRTPQATLHLITDSTSPTAGLSLIHI